MSYKTDNLSLKQLMIDHSIDITVSLCVASGIDLQTLKKVLCGEEQPSSDVMEKLKEVLNISPEKAGQIFFCANLHEPLDNE